MEFNDTMTLDMLTTTMMIPVPVKRHVTLASQIVLTLVYMCGVIGNISALVILFHKDKRRNPKHLFMLRCLAINDLVALLGMLVQMHVTIYTVDSVTSSRSFCSLRIAWRLFGLFSGCVAIVMAVERWLALTRPFIYQKRITFPVIVRCMLLLWIAALTLTTLPLFGFGIYYKNDKCMRYREATEPRDVAYAYVWFSSGTFLCISIVWCNLAVSLALRRLGNRVGALRRSSKASSRTKPLLVTAKTPSTEIGLTAEERAFAKLMAVLSISFVICWMPQMIGIPLAQLSLKLPASAVLARKLIRIFHIVADILLCIHFTLDPYIYVLLRMPRPRFRLLKPICKFCWPQRSRESSFTGITEPMTTTDADPPTPITEVPSTLGAVTGSSSEIENTESHGWKLSIL
uniref:PTGER4_0 protein n=1 Tax=Fopius arisanus TaxID=64838 RepID=A0A0C9R9U9_9HYME